MNVNRMVEEVGSVVDCPVELDVYSGRQQRYITYTYEDERPDMQGDNRALADTAYIQIHYFVPREYDYMADKHKIRDYLEQSGFKVTSIRSWMENKVTGFQNTRHILFETNYTEMRRKQG